MVKVLMRAFAATAMLIAAGPAATRLNGQELRQEAAGYVVTLRLPPEGLAAGEEMQIEFRLEDRRNSQAPQPVRFARVRAVVEMPSMPAMPAFDELAHDEGVAGEYGAHPTFAHGGDYRLTLTLLPADQQPPGITPPGPVPFSMQFPLLVSDPRPPSPTAGPTAVKRFGLQVKPAAAPRAGVPVDLTVTVINHFTQQRLPGGGSGVGDGPVPEFDQVHERSLHLFFVRDDLGAFAHEHPDGGEQGTFHLQFTFPTPGRYRVFADVAPRHAGAQILMDEIVVEGVPPLPFNLGQALAAQPTPRVSTVDGITVEWQWLQPLPARRTSVVSAQLRTAAGAEVGDLELYLGARGHLMLVHEDGLTFVHSHPDERVPPTPGETVVPFLARFPKPGLYRGWGQFQRGGRIITTDFVVRAGE
jgi:hypothetical protein